MAVNKNPDPKEVGQRIASLCERLHWTQSDLAKKTGITEASISQFINGVRLPSTPLLHKLAKVFDVTTDLLLTGDDQSPKDFPESARVLYRDYASLDDAGQKFVRDQLDYLKSLQKKSKDK